MASDGSIFVGGQTQSTDFPVTAGAFQAVFGGGTDAFLSRISNDGSQLLYSTFLGGAADETIQSLIANADGTLLIAGTASGAGLPVSATAYQKTAPGADDYFIAKAAFSQTGVLSLPYLTFLGGKGNGQELGFVAMVTDSTGNVYVGGGTTSADYPVTANAYEKPFATSGGCYNTQLPNTIGTPSKLSRDLSQLLYSTVIGGHTEDQNGDPVCNQFVRTVHVDASGNIWLIGTVGMSDFLVTSNAMSKQLNGDGLAGVDDFITELSADGTKLLYSSYFGGSQFDYGSRAAWDAAGHLWITTTTQSPDYPVTADAFQKASAGGYDTGVTELSADATTILYSTYLGGSGDEDLNGSGQIKIDGQGNVRLTGTTYSTNYPVTRTATQLSFANGDQGPDCSDLYYAVLGTGLIGSVGPVLGGNSGDTTLTITGAGFKAGATCQLNLSGTLITAGQVAVLDNGTKITCGFALSGAAAGTYDVVITNPGAGGSFTKAAAFTVQSGGAPNMWVNILARPKIRTGVPSSVTVSYGNSGTVDAYMSHLVVSMPSNIQATFVAGVPPTLPSGQQVPTSLTQGGLNTIRLLLPRVPAGSSGSFQMAITDTTNNDNYTLNASIAKPWFTTAASAQTALTAAAAAYTPAITCVSATAPTNCLGAYLTNLQKAGATAAQTQSIASTMLTTLQQVEKYGATPVIDGQTLGFLPPSQIVNGTLVLTGVVSYDDTINYHVAGLPQQNNIKVTSSNCVAYAANVNDALGGSLLRCTLSIQAPTGAGIIVAGGSYGSGGTLIPTFDTCFTAKQDISAAGFTINATAGTQFCQLNADTGDDVAPKVPDDVIIVIGGFDNTESSSQSDLLPDGGTGGSAGGASGGSIVPNGKSGPTGDGTSSHYVQAKASLSYNVYFENQPTATLPAAQVVVTDQLDPTKVDINTVTLGPVTFGTSTLTPPANSTGFALTYATSGQT